MQQILTYESGFTSTCFICKTRRPFGSQQWQQDAWGERPLTFKTVLWETWSSFWTRTSISGISNAGNARHTIARVLWLGLTVVGLYFTTRDAVTVVQEYLKYPYTTQVQLFSPGELSLGRIVCVFRFFSQKSLFVTVFRFCDINSQCNIFYAQVSETANQVL